MIFRGVGVKRVEIDDGYEKNDNNKIHLLDR